MGIFLEPFDLVFFLLNFKIHLVVTQLSWLKEYEQVLQKLR
jgi:hypothetical protein